MIDLQTALALINLGGLVVAIIQLYRQRKDTEHLARITNNLERELQHLNVELDQNIQRLYRAREATIQRHKAAIYLLEFNRLSHELPEQAPQFPPNEIFQKYAEYSAHWAELRGLARAIGDKDLWDLVKGKNETYQSEDLSLAMIVKEMDIRGQSQQIHTRISELIAETINNKK